MNSALNSFGVWGVRNRIGRGWVQRSKKKGIIEPSPKRKPGWLLLLWKLQPKEEKWIWTKKSGSNGDGVGGNAKFIREKWNCTEGSEKTNEKYRKSGIHWSLACSLLFISIIIFKYINRFSKKPHSHTQTACWRKSTKREFTVHPNDREKKRERVGINSEKLPKCGDSSVCSTATNTHYQDPRPRAYHRRRSASTYYPIRHLVHHSDFQSGRCGAHTLLIIQIVQEHVPP